MIAIDSSALVKYLVREEGWFKVRKYLEEGCITLDFAIKEVLNVVWKRVAVGELDESYACKVVSLFLKSEIVKKVDQEQFMQKAFLIAVRNRITVYDSLFIALAKENNIPLLTSDKKQAEAAERENVKVILV